MEKISVNLYGGKSIFNKKESPLRAEEVYCDNYEKCSLFKNNCCLSVTAPFSTRCKFGKVNRIQGYTSRAKKYKEFRTKYEKDETYGKLSYPSNCKIAIIDNNLFLDVGFAKIEESNNEYNVNSVNFGSSENWIELEKFDCNLLYKICTYKPYAIMGGEITSYKEKYIPDMLLQLKKLLPELYNDFITKYPEFDKAPNYIGKYAYIKTLVKDSVLIDSNGNKFIFNGEYLICENWKSAFVPFDSKTSEMRIKVTDDMKYKINDNSQANENTIFKQ